MAGESVRVLDVGNCDPDHGAIRAMLLDHFDVVVDRVMFVDEAIERMRQRDYALILVNRLIFADSSPGIELLRQAKQVENLGTPAIMMVSNYPEAQQASIAAGGVQGFGKALIGKPEAVALLSQYLPRRVKR